MKFSRKTAAFAAVLAGVLVAGTACGGSDDENASGGDITLTVDTFGAFGYEELFTQYEAAHPGIKIEHRNEKEHEKVYVPKLLQYLETGSGAGDVVALEEGVLTSLRGQADKFIDFNGYGGAELEANFIKWKYDLGKSLDGKSLMALGTDVGGLAMCYRTDLFEKAGLPTERDEVSKLWPTWADYSATGAKFQDKVADTKFVDGPAALYNAILSQEAPKNGNYTYFDNAGAYVADKNPAVKTAFDTVNGLKDLSAGLKAFTPEWQTGFKKDSFATMACPAWMLGVIKENSGDAYAGKWDVASVPGGGGNWGGSYLAVPKQSEHPKEAAELAEFLTSPESQIAAFKAVNALPTSPQALADPQVADAKNDYFNDAPVGKIFAAGASTLQPVQLGVENVSVRTVFEDILIAIGQGQLSAGEGWTKAIEDGRKKSE
ncbi:cellobiose transport system substrate-binding protein [Actinocorallia herbida]|uniref:Cellobiose transport system substrate-binding protein n=1 Tax=Actinocorallia herbida TaxID=58109 RepID=A0A3N1CQU2_9ACTN|nr:extracellular solute-binding protein [Actinocorallia herbida]ROO83514.1 cellobiose transport system substrate-binding protein [Actinocorallia herbida]